MSANPLNAKIAAPYARALFDISIEKNIMHQITIDFQNLEIFLIENSELADCLNSPVVSQDAKYEILSEILKSEIHVETFRFLTILIKRNRIDFLDNRDMISADFSSLGFDLRASRIWDNIDKESLNALVTGIQGYTGNTMMKQGHADATDLPHFEYLNPDDLEGSDFTLPNNQLSAFAQGIVSLSSNLSITPGLRWEYIDTRANGWYREYIIDGAGNIIEDSIFTSNKSFQRHVVLPGIGFSYKAFKNVEVYGNGVANFRAINFSDIQIRNLGVVVDPDINDESGSNIDIGARSNSGVLNWDVSVFMLNYNDKIGLYPTTIPDPIIVEKPVLLRTNIANARTYGLEGLIQATIFERDARSMDLLVSASLMKG